MISQSGFTEIQQGSEERAWSNSGDGKTNLKTSIVVKDKTGKEIEVSTLQGLPTWDYLPQGSYIQYEIETISDGDGKSDKVQLDIIYDNDAPIFREYDLQIQALSPEELEMYENGSTVIEERLLKLTEQAVIDKSIPPTITIWSKLINTDSNGKASGTIPIGNNWPITTYSLMIHYGYDGAAEGVTWGDRMAGNLYNAVSIAVFAVAFVVSGGTAGVVLGVAGGVMAVGEIAYGLAQAYLWTGYGPSTENKHGVSFPDYGFNHAYGFGTDPALAEDEGVLGDFDFGMNNEIMGGFIALVLLALIIKKRRSK